MAELPSPETLALIILVSTLVDAWLSVWKHRHDL